MKSVTLQLPENLNMDSTIKPLLKKIKQTDFRLTEEIEVRALKEAGE